MKKNSVLLLLLLSSLYSFSKVNLPSILGDNAVLQRNSKVKLWGSANAGTMVTITTSWDNIQINTKADREGKWMTAIHTPEAGGPYRILYNDGEETITENIAIGEVWFCSGQSNMQMLLRGAMNQPILHSADLIANATNKWLRLFKVPTALSAQPVEDLDNTAWNVSTPKSAAVFSALAFQFGKMLQEHLDIPVGIIVSAYGGTPVRGWMAPEYLKEFPAMAKDTTIRINHWGPSYLYNAMVYPLRNFSIRGFLWYQGERDVSTPFLYEKMLPAMVENWRALWDGGDKFPFYYVQLAPWTYSNASGFNGAYMREAQLKARDMIPNSGIVTTIDVGSDLSIHPPDKTTVAKRLLYQALVQTYSMKGIPYTFPEYEEMEIQDSTILLRFNHAPRGLSLHEKITAGLEIAGEDRKFYPVTTAKTIGAKGLQVSSNQVSKPVAVRYCFRNYSTGNLYDNFGMPVFPFRTDNWNE